MESRDSAGHDPFQLGTGIHRLRASNFRSFENVALDFGRLNVFIGPNASGKSNILHALRFLRDLASDGLDDAIGLQGGIELLTNVRNKLGPVEIEVSYSETQGSRFIKSLLITGDGAPIRYGAPRSTYHLTIQPSGGQKFTVTRDRLVMQFAFEIDGKPPLSTDYGERNVVLTIENVGDVFEIKFISPEWARLEASPLFHFISDQRRALPSSSTIFDQAASIFDFHPSAFFKDVPFFNFEPDLAREAIFVEGKAKLDDDGENLPIVLRRLFEEAEKRGEFKQLITSLLPYVSDINVETYSDLTSTINVTESYSHTALPASALSTGTIDIAALIAALYFDDSPVIAFEEPERYIHASLISRIAQLLKERSRSHQLFVTTHNSHMIRALSDCTLFALYRDRAGYSRAVKPESSPIISAFLVNELGVDDLNAVGLLHE